MSDQHKPLTAAEIEDLRKLEAKATPGPWAFGPYGDENKYGVGVVMDENDEPVVGFDETEDGIVVESVAPEVEGHANATLIAAMRNMLPRLLSMLTPPTDAVSPDAPLSLQAHMSIGELRYRTRKNGIDSGWVEGADVECVAAYVSALEAELSALKSGPTDAELREAVENLALTLRLLGDSPPERVCIPVSWLRILLRSVQAPRLTKEQVEARRKAERELAEANSSEAPKSSLRTHAPDCAVNHPMSGKPWCMACTCGAEKPKPPFTEAVRLIREEFGHNWKDAKPGTCLMGADYSNPVPEAEWKCPREGCGWETALAGSGCCPGGGDPRKAGPCDKRQPEPEDCPECDGAGQQINVLAGPTSGLMRNCPACHGTGIKGFVPEPKDEGKRYCRVKIGDDEARVLLPRELWPAGQVATEEEKKRIEDYFVENMRDRMVRFVMSQQNEEGK